MTQPVEERITSYLPQGGLFNPELANHDEVRNLLMDCRSMITDLRGYIAGCEKMIPGDGLLAVKIALLVKEVDDLQKELARRDGVRTKSGE